MFAKLIHISNYQRLISYFEKCQLLVALKYCKMMHIHSTNIFSVTAAF